MTDSSSSDKNGGRRPLPPLGAGRGSRGRGGDSWIDLDRRHLWHPYTQMAVAPPPVPVARGEGLYLVTPDGRRILDGISSWWVNIHGHSHPRLNRALAAQAERLEHVMFAGFTHEPAARLAAELSARAPGDLPWVFYSDDGSTAVEVALKMAYQGWRQRGETGRNLFLALDDAYHGDTFGAMAAGGAPEFHGMFEELFFEVRRVATPVSARRPEHGADLAEVLAREGDRVAAMIVEPMVQGAGGMIFQPPEFLAEVRRLTAEREIPLIADEIFTGFGRTGRFFACEHAGVEPDLVCVSKALSGGYLPLAATLATDEIYRSFLSDDRQETFFHGHSYTANPLACAVGLEGLAVFEEEGYLARIGELEAMFTERLARLAELPAVTTTRCLGAIAVVELATRGRGGYLDEMGPPLADEFLARDLLLRPLGNTLYFLPPYVVTDEEVAWVFDAMEEVVGKL